MALTMPRNSRPWRTFQNPTVQPVDLTPRCQRVENHFLVGLASILFVSRMGCLVFRVNVKPLAMVQSVSWVGLLYERNYLVVDLPGHVLVLYRSKMIDLQIYYNKITETRKRPARAIDEGLVNRSDLFITSKLWNTFHEKDRVEPITRKQLEWWGLDYFDLFHIHFPVALEYYATSPKRLFASNRSQNPTFTNFYYMNRCRF
jgi:hypothetical protein